MDKPATPGRPRRHRVRNWLIAVGAVLVVLVGLVVLVVIRVQPQSGPPPLNLPAGTTAPVPAGAVSGTWTVSAGSTAGFRVQQTMLGRKSDVVGRTSAVTGTVAVGPDRIDAATFRVDLTTIKVQGEVQAQFVKSMDTAQFPTATLRLTQPIRLGSGLDTGATVRATATGELTLHGVTRAVSFPFSGRRNGSELQAVGSIPIIFTDWDIKPPTNYGSLGSLADHGVAEFFLVLHRQ